MSPGDPHWVGAWWIGFLVGGVAALLVSFPILGYPRQLPGTAHLQSTDSLTVCEAGCLPPAGRVKNKLRTFFTVIDDGVYEMGGA